MSYFVDLSLYKNIWEFYCLVRNIYFVIGFVIGSIVLTANFLGPGFFTGNLGHSEEGTDTNASRVSVRSGPCSCCSGNGSSDDGHDNDESRNKEKDQKQKEFDETFKRAQILVCVIFSVYLYMLFDYSTNYSLSSGLIDSTTELLRILREANERSDDVE